MVVIQIRLIMLFMLLSVYLVSLFTSTVVSGHPGVDITLSRQDLSGRK